MKTIDISKIKARLDGIADGFSNRVVKVGFFEGKGYNDGTPYAYVAAIHEYGSPEAGIPPRPFMRPTVEAQSNAWSKNMQQGMRSVARGELTADEVLERVGRTAAGDIQTRIASNQVAPLSPVTLVLRKWRREGKPITGKTVGEAAAAYAADPSIIGGVPADPLQDTSMMLTHVQSAVGDAE